MFQLILVLFYIFIIPSNSWCFVNIFCM